MGELLEARLELLDELLCNVFMDESTGGGDAGLTRVEQEVLAVMLQRDLEVGVREYQARGLAAQFKSDPFEVARDRISYWLL